MYYFKPTNTGGFRGRTQKTLATTLDRDLKAAACVPIRQVKTIADLSLFKIAAQDRDSWRLTIKIIEEIVQAKALHHDQRINTFKKKRKSWIINNNVYWNS